jgi:hypothetical protein
VIALSLNLGLDEWRCTIPVVRQKAPFPLPSEQAIDEPGHHVHST